MHITKTIDGKTVKFFLNGIFLDASVNNGPDLAIAVQFTFDTTPSKGRWKQGPRWNEFLETLLHPLTFNPAPPYEEDEAELVKTMILLTACVAVELKKGQE